MKDSRASAARSAPELAQLTQVRALHAHDARVARSRSMSLRAAHVDRVHDTRAPGQEDVVKPPSGAGIQAC